MAAALWTATLRVIEVFTAALAVGVIVVSLQAARARAEPPVAETGGPAPFSQVLAETQPVQPVRATAEPSPTAARPATVPDIRYPAPSDALPATRAQAVSGQTSTSTRPQSSSPPSRSLAAVLQLGASLPPDTAQAALLAKQSLEAQGYEISLAEGDVTTEGSGPLRPDAYVLIQSVTGEGTSPGVEAWFCQVEGSLGSQLADLLLKGLAASGLSSVGQGDGEITNAEAFQCDLLLAGRHRMPTVLLEVPAAPDGNGPALAQGVADGIDRFFRAYWRTLVQEDQRQRLVWPAIGPITSYFGPSHPLGIDIGQSNGRILAATDGVVLFAGGNRCCSYGLYVVVESPDGIITLYAHLDSVIVAEGERVRQGQPLGIVGCTGNCFGTHLHFEVIDGGVRQDPLYYLPGQ